MTTPIAMDPHAPCPCHHGASYGVCCKPLHDGQAAPTAECLMRSRYAAYVLKLMSYLLSTWHPSTRPSSLDLDSPKWLGLQVKHHHETGDTATVEFVARYIWDSGAPVNLSVFQNFNFPMPPVGQVKVPRPYILSALRSLARSPYGSYIRAASQASMEYSTMPNAPARLSAD